jgi:hypothetical protein
MTQYMNERRRGMGYIPASYPGGHSFNSGYTDWGLSWFPNLLQANVPGLLYFRNLPNSLSLTGDEKETLNTASVIK